MAILGGYTTISAKVPFEVEGKLKKLGIKQSKVLRKAIEEAIREEEVKGENRGLKAYVSQGPDGRRSEID